MSVKVMARVWEYFPSGGTELLALLALADWSDDEGNCFPSMSSIAKKIRLSESQTRRAVHSLIDSDYLLVLANAMGGAPGSSRKYQVNLGRLTPSMDDTPTPSMDATRRDSVDERGTASTGDTPIKMETGVMDARDGCHPCAETGVTHDTLTTIYTPLTTNIVSKQVSPASSTPSKKLREKKSALTLEEFFEQCHASGAKLILDDDPIFEYAEKVGISHDMLKVCWNEFKSTYIGTGKKQKDWRAHYRNAVRRNWYSLWFIREGDEVKWTTQGEQARRAAA